MNVLFVIKKDVYSVQAPMGIMYLSSVLKANGHGVFLSDSSLENIGRFIKEKKIGLFGISCMNTDFKYYLNLSQTIKKKFPKIPIIWGGPTPTYNPDIVREKGVDIICRGEGEIALLELVNRMDKKQNIKKIPNLWVKNNSVISKNPVGPSITDLDTLPFPDRSLLDPFPQFKYAPVKFVAIGRGCPFNCSFCFNHQLHELYKGKGRVVRTRSVGSVIKELEEVKANYNAKFIYFPDDVFPFEEAWISDFAEQYSKKINLPFTIVTSVVFINETVVKSLKKAGCVSIHIAIECGNEKIRREVLNKPVSNKQIIKACRIIKKHGIAICAYNMIGIPFTNFENEVETLDFNLKLKIDVPYVFFCLPFLDTQLGKTALKAGLMSDKTEILSWFEKIPLEIKDKEKIEKFAQLFTVISLFPSLRRHLDLLLKIPVPQSILKFIKDILNGYGLKKKILPAKVSYQEFFVSSFYFISKRFTK